MPRGVSFPTGLKSQLSEAPSLLEIAVAKFEFLHLIFQVTQHQDGSPSDLLGSKTWRPGAGLFVIEQIFESQ